MANDRDEIKAKGTVIPGTKTKIRALTLILSAESMWDVSYQEFFDAAKIVANELKRIIDGEK